MPRVLIIDDDTAIHQAFRLALEKTSCEVQVASSGEAGLEELAKTGADLVYLDLKMPGADGVEILRRLRANGHKMPVYIVTGFAEEFMAALRAAAEEGLDFEVARKPLARKEIREITASKLGLDPS